MATTTGKFFTACLVFADIKGFTALNRDALLVEFFETLYKDLALKVKNTGPMSVNSWGDAIFAVYDDPVTAANSAILVRDFFSRFNWTDSTLPKMSVRVAVHVGRAYKGFDPIRETEGFVGTQINLAARIEPVTRPGEVWTTDTFISLLESASPDHLSWDSIGVVALAKNWGGKQLFVLRGADEPPRSDVVVFDDDLPPSSPLDSIGAAIKLYEKGDDAQKLTALDMMGKKEDERSFGVLTEVALDQILSPRLRGMAISSLGELRSIRALPTFVKVIENLEEAPSIHLSALSALISIGDPRAEDFLIQLLGTSDVYPEIIVKKGIDALALIGSSRAADQILTWISEGKLRNHLAQLIATLYVLGTSKIAEVLVPYCDDSQSYSVRKMAIHVFVRNDPSAIEDILKRIANDESEQRDLRGAAFAGLVKIGNSSCLSILEGIAGRAERDSDLALEFLMQGKEFVEEHEKESLRRMRDEL